MRRAISALAFASVLLATPCIAREMNLSQFVFVDRNGNGIYDETEQPFAGAYVTAEHESGAFAEQNSNLAGFTNFAMSDDEEDKDITLPGEWTFRVTPPSWMGITTENPAQVTTIRPQAHSPGGFVADPPLPFVGLAPNLLIETPIAGADRVTCSNKTIEIEAKLDAEREQFICPSAVGRWNVTWFRDGNAIGQRQTEIVDWPVRAPFPSEPPAPLDADFVELDFDSLLTSQNIMEMPSGPGGVYWHNMVANHRLQYGGWGYVNGTTSGEYSLYNSSGHPARLYHDQPFDFIGAFVSVAWPKAMKGKVRIQGLRNGVVVAEDAFYASNLRPVWVDARFQNITELRVSHDNYWQVVLDDMRLTPPSDQ